MKKWLIYILCGWSLQVAAQGQPSRKAQNHFQQALRFLGQQHFNEGIRDLKTAVALEPTYVEAHLQLALVYRKTRQYESALPHFEKAMALQGPENSIFFLQWGETALLSGKYALAQQQLTHFLTLHPLKEEEIKLANKYLKDCTFALQAMLHPIPYQAINMGEGINSPYRDYYPTLTANGETIIFSRVVNGNEDFYTAHLTEGIWSRAVPLSQRINTPQFNEGAQSISPDGKYLFFTGCNRPDGLGSCDLFVSRKEGKDWGKPTNLGNSINSSYWDSQPAISPDGMTLFFVSNRPGGYGGYDLWKTTYSEEGQWSVPENLGPEINTEFDEFKPFLHADGKTLYFSSNGWPGMGDQDIFYSRFENGKFNTPVNLGYPINTHREESGLMVSADGKTGYFSTVREDGFGDMDIYQFQLPDHLKPLPVTYVKGVVRDEETRQLLEANLLIVDLKTNLAIYNDYTSPETGDFLAVIPIGSTYSFYVEADGYLFHSDNYELTEVCTQQPYEIEISLKRIRKGQKVTMRNIFFDTDRYELLTASIGELQLLADFLKENPKVAIEIQGHTDSTGSDQSNRLLSEQRAKAVHDYLIMQQIPAQRLRYKGFGATQPSADNQSEEGRRQNRRTEFVITYDGRN